MHRNDSLPFARPEFSSFRAAITPNLGARKSPGSRWMRLAATVAALALPMGHAALAQTPVVGQTTAYFASGLNEPSKMIKDAAGNLYISDTGSHHVIKETLLNGGYSQSVIANESGMLTGLAVDAKGNVYVADQAHSALYKLTPSSSGSYTSTTLLSGSPISLPTDLALDASGNFYLLNKGGASILKLAPKTGGGYTTTTVVANTGSSKALGFTLDANRTGAVAYVADTENSRILAADLVHGTTSVLITKAQGNFSEPVGISLDASGNFYVSDAGDAGVLVISQQTIGVAKVWITTGFYHTTRPAAFLLDNENLPLILDSKQNYAFSSGNAGLVNNAVVPLGGTPIVIPITFKFAATTTLSSTTPVTVTTGGAQGLDFTQAPGGTCTRGVSISGSGPASCTVNVQFTPLASGLRRGSVSVFDKNQNLVAAAQIHGVGAGAQLNYLVGANAPSSAAISKSIPAPQSLAFDGAGNLFVTNADLTGNSYPLYEFTATSNFANSIPMGKKGWVGDGLAIDGAGNVFVHVGETGQSSSTAYTYYVLEYTQASGYKTSKSLLQDGVQDQYVTLAADNAGNIFMAHPATNQVNELPASGGNVNLPHVSGYLSGVAADGNGNLLVVATSGTLATVFEYAAPGYAAPVQLGSVNGGGSIALDGQGNFYLPLPGGTMIRFLAATGYQSAVEASVKGVNLGIYGTFTGFAADPFGNIATVDRSQPGLGILYWDLADPPSLSFPSVPVGSTKTGSTVAVWNYGNQPLLFTEPYDGSNPYFPPQFPAGSPESCSPAEPVNPGASCEIAPTLQPTQAGPIDDYVLMMDNALGQTDVVQAIAVFGGGLATQTISFPALPSQHVTTLPILLPASASSGLPVVFSVVSGPATVHGDWLVLNVPAGTTTLPQIVVAANQAGNAYFSPAPQVTETITLVH
jgi:sugar lactone lactonase YvrE